MNIHEIDTIYYSMLALASMEPVVWWCVVQRKLPNPKPLVIWPALLSSLGICAAMITLLAASALLWQQGGATSNTIVWIPLLRRVLGGFLLVPVAAHWVWRRRFK